MLFEEETNKERWILKKCEFEFSKNESDYICRLKIEGPTIISKKYNLRVLIKSLLYPLSEKFIFIFDLICFISSCERIDNFFTGSKNPIETLNSGMNLFLQEILLRPDVVSSMNFMEFFKLKEKSSKASLLPLKELISVKIKAWEDEMLVHKVNYDSDNRVLVLNCKLNGMFANFGRIWSVIEKVNLSAIEVYHTQIISQGNRIELNHKLTFMSQEMVNDVNLFFNHEDQTQDLNSSEENFPNFEEEKENSFEALNESVMTVSDWHQE